MPSYDPSYVEAPHVQRPPAPHSAPPHSEGRATLPPKRILERLLRRRPLPLGRWLAWIRPPWQSRGGAQAPDMPAQTSQPAGQSSRLPEAFLDRLTAPIPQERADTLAQRRLCGRWLALRMLQQGLSNRAISQQIGVDEQSLLLLLAGLADQALARAPGWDLLSRLLADNNCDQPTIDRIVQFALGQTANLPPVIALRVHADLYVPYPSAQAHALAAPSWDGGECGAEPRDLAAAEQQAAVPDCADPPSVRIADALFQRLLSWDSAGAQDALTQPLAGTFRSCCRQLHARHGWLGLLPVWLMILWSLANVWARILWSHAKVWLHTIAAAARGRANLYSTAQRRSTLPMWLLINGISVLFTALVSPYVLFHLLALSQPISAQQSVQLAALPGIAAMSGNSYHEHQKLEQPTQRSSPADTAQRAGAPPDDSQQPPSGMPASIARASTPTSTPTSTPLPSAQQAGFRMLMHKPTPKVSPTRQWPKRTATPTVTAAGTATPTATATAVATATPIITATATPTPDITCQAEQFDIVLVFDRSNTAAGPDLAAAKLTAKHFVQQLDLSLHQISIVTFSSQATVDLALTHDQAAIEQAIDAITAGSGSNIAAGIAAADAELSSARHNPAAYPTMILLSDGNSTAGGSPEDAAAQAQQHGVLIYSIGLGENINDALMARIASSFAHYYTTVSAANLDAIYQTIASNFNIVICSSTAAAPPGQ